MNSTLWGFNGFYGASVVFKGRLQAPTGVSGGIPRGLKTFQPFREVAGDSTLLKCFGEVYRDLRWFFWGGGVFELYQGVQEILGGFRTF